MKRKKKKVRPWYFVKAKIVRDGIAELISAEGDCFHVEIRRESGEILVSRMMRWHEMKQAAGERKDPENPESPPSGPRLRRLRLVEKIGRV